MPYRDQPRKATKEQFSANTTIDGNRIDRATEDVTDRFNDIPLADIRRRFVSNTLVQGWTPQEAVFYDVTANDQLPYHHFPWLDLYNHWRARDDSNSMVVDTTQTPTFQNPFRIKGTSIPGIDHEARLAFDNHPQGRQYAWTTTLYFSKPAVLYDWSIMMLTDVEHGTAASPQNFTYDGVTPPEGETAGDPSKDVVVCISVDNPFNPDRQVYSSQVVARNRFEVSRENVSLNALPATGFADFAPTVFGSARFTNALPPAGMWMDLSMNVPVPRNSRVRMAIVIPAYDGVVVGPGSWGDSTSAIYYPDPWYRMKPGSQLSWLEEIE